MASRRDDEREGEFGAEHRDDCVWVKKMNP